MSHDHDIPVPKAFVYGGLGLMALSIAVAWIGVETGAAEKPALDIAVSTPLHFRDEADGGVAVLSAETGERIFTFASGDGGFARVALRALASDRRRSGVGQDAPYEVARATNGRLYLLDPQTDFRIALDAFGGGNADDFGQLLDMEAVR